MKKKRNTLILVLIFIGIFVNVNATKIYNEIAIIKDLEDRIQDIIVQDNYLIFGSEYAGNGDLYVYDISNILSPSLIKHIECPGFNIYDLFIENNNLYVCGEKGLRIYDFSDPYSLPLLTEIKEVNGKSIGSWCMTKSNNILFVQSGWSGLLAIDMKDIYNPVYLDIINYTGILNEVKVLNESTLLACDGYNMYFINISNPSYLSKTTLAIPGDPSGIFIANTDYAYLTYYSSSSGKGVKVIDLKNQSVIKTIDLSEYGYGFEKMAQHGDTLVIAYSDGFIALDIANPESPVFLESIEPEYIGTCGNAICVTGNNLFISNNYDIIIYAIGGSVQQLPNLIPFQPDGWSDIIVIDNNTGSYTSLENLTTDDNLFIDFSFINSSEYDINQSIYCDIYVDSVLWYQVKGDSLPSYYYYYYWDAGYGKLSAGNHTIKMVVDPNNTIEESNEKDNEYSVSIDVSGNTTSILSSKNNKQMSIYPNPAKDKVIISGLPVNENLHISISNSTGQILKRIQSDGSDETEIDLSGFRNGIYLVSIETNDNIQVTKILKQ